MAGRPQRMAGGIPSGSVSQYSRSDGGEEDEFEFGEEEVGTTFGTAHRCTSYNLSSTWSRVSSGAEGPFSIAPKNLFSFLAKALFIGSDDTRSSNI